MDGQQGGTGMAEFTPGRVAAPWLAAPGGRGTVHGGTWRYMVTLLGHTWSSSGSMAGSTAVRLENSGSTMTSKNYGGTHAWWYIVRRQGGIRITLAVRVMSHGRGTDVLQQHTPHGAREMLEGSSR